MITKKEEAQLMKLREMIPAYISGKRLSHTLGVERESASLAGIFAPGKEYLLRTAALLHDITKQYTTAEQVAICDKYGISYTCSTLSTPKIFHAMTAAKLIAENPSFCEDETIREEVVSAVRYHTTGRADMSLSEKIIYLADYIEDTRTFEDCIGLRKFFYDGIADAKDEREKMAVLRDTLILSFDMTIKGLIEERTPIHPDTTAARNFLIEEQYCEQ